MTRPFMKLSFQIGLQKCQFSLTSSFLCITESSVLCWLRRTDKKNTSGDKGAEDRDKNLPKKYMYGKQASHKS